MCSGSGSWLCASAGILMHLALILMILSVVTSSLGIPVLVYLLHRWAITNDSVVSPQDIHVRVEWLFQDGCMSITCDFKLCPFKFGGLKVMPAQVP